MSLEDSAAKTIDLSETDLNTQAIVDYCHAPNLAVSIIEHTALDEGLTSGLGEWTSYIGSSTPAGAVKARAFFYILRAGLFVKVHVRCYVDSIVGSEADRMIFNGMLPKWAIPGPRNSASAPLLCVKTTNENAGFARVSSCGKISIVRFLPRGIYGQSQSRPLKKFPAEYYSLYYKL